MFFFIYRGGWLKKKDFFLLLLLGVDPALRTRIWWWFLGGFLGKNLSFFSFPWCSFSRWGSSKPGGGTGLLEAHHVGFPQGWVEEKKSKGGAFSRKGYFFFAVKKYFADVVFFWDLCHRNSYLEDGHSCSF